MGEDAEDVGINAESTKKLGGSTGKGFMPGVSGNPTGRPKKSLFTQEIEARLNDPVIAKELADKVISLIKAGESSMLKQAWDRTDGPVKEQIEHSGSIESMPAEQKAAMIAEILATAKSRKAKTS